jgi:Co/Zn/Cd efflux system component
MAVEVTVGILASSLALLSDAAHMLTDATAIGLSLITSRTAQRPTGRLTLPRRGHPGRTHGNRLHSAV